jgi:hypothetical protein
MKNFLILICMTFLLSACGSTPVKRDGLVSAELKEFASQRMQAHLLFVDAAMHVPVQASDACSMHDGREPFWFDTTGMLRRVMKPEQRTALYQAGHLDEHWSVIATDDNTGLKLGDSIEKLNDTSIGDPEYFPARSRVQYVREEALERGALTVQLSDGRKLSVPIKKGCAGTVLGFGYFTHPSDQEFIEIIPSVRTILPGNVISNLQDRDEAAYAVLWAHYFLSTEEAKQANIYLKAGAAATLTGSVASVVLLGPVGLVLTQTLGKAALNGVKHAAIAGMPARADEWAQSVMARYGYDPTAAVRLNESQVRLKLKAEWFLMDEERLAAARKKSAALPTGNPAPKRG